MQTEENLNVVFVSNHHYPYGMASSKRIRLFAENLPKNWTRSIVITGKDNGRNPEFGQYNGLDYRLEKFSVFDYLFNVYRVYSVLRKQYQTGKKNILFLYSNIRVTNFWFAIVGKILSYKVVTDIVEDQSVLDQKVSKSQALKIRLSVWLQRFLDLLVDGAVVISTRLSDKHKNLNKVILIPISAENLLHSRTKKREPKGVIRFVYSGTFKEKDGIERLIEAFVKEVEPAEGELWFSGMAPQNHIDLMESVSNIQFNGLIPDEEYYQYLADADVLLMTRTESAYANTGFPFKLGEFLATGNPVICTRVGDVSEYLTDKTDVIMAEASDEASMRKALRFVIENMEEAKEIGLKGKDSCRTFFHPVQNGEKLATFLSDI